MTHTRVPIILILTLLFLIFPVSSEKHSRLGAQERDVRADSKSGQRRKMLEYLRRKHPEVLETARRIRKQEKEVQNLAEAYAVQTDEGKKNEIEQRLRVMIEEILRHQFEITDRTLENLAAQYEQLRKRHDRNRGRFDEIVESRLRRLLNKY